MSAFIDCVHCSSLAIELPTFSPRGVSLDMSDEIATTWRQCKHMLLRLFGMVGHIHIHTMLYTMGTCVECWVQICLCKLKLYFYVGIFFIILRVYYCYFATGRWEMWYVISCLISMLLYLFLVSSVYTCTQTHTHITCCMWPNMKLYLSTSYHAEFKKTLWGLVVSFCWL